MNAEVIIVGGGIIGCAAAYHLQKRVSRFSSWRAVRTLETEAPPAMEAGSDSQGAIPESFPRMYAIQHLWKNLSEMLDTDVEYYQHGNLRLGSTEKHRDILTG